VGKQLAVGTSDSAQEFLSALDPSSNAEYCIEVYKKSDPVIKERFAVTMDNLTGMLPKLEKLNNKGAGVYHAVNSFSGTRKKDNLRRVRAVHADFDESKKETLQELFKLLQPSVMVVTSPKKCHIYYLLEPDEELSGSECEQLNKAIARSFGADTNSTDCARLLRLPGFHHMKDPANPHLVIFRDTGSRYTCKQIKDAFLSGETEGNQQSITKGVQADQTMLNLMGARAPLEETPENVQHVEEMLKHIPADCTYGDWCTVAWSITSLGWNCTEKLLVDWSQTSLAHWSEEKSEKTLADLKTIIAGYDPSKGITIGSAFHMAQDHGWQGMAAQLPGDGAHEHDIANGKVFAIGWRGQLLFVHDTNEWLFFKSKFGWLKAQPLDQDAAAKEIVKLLRKEAADAYQEDHESSRTKKLMAIVKRASQLSHLRAMIEMAKSEPGMSEQLSSFDADNFVLGVRNGIMDLNSRKLAPFTPGVLVSNRTNVMYDPKATCARFQQYLNEVVPDAGYRAFLRRWCGYCLTGSVSEQKMLFLHGAGRNGKSVFVELLAYILGDYTKKIQTEMLMKHSRSPQAASPDIVGLKARRLVYCNETTEGRFFDDARIKELTGGDTLVGRVPYAKSDIEFYPTHKLMIVGNHLPSVMDHSFGFWRRVILFPFEQIIAKESVDKNLLDKLKKEAPGILNWMLDGLDQWSKRALSIPKGLISATNAYKDEQDILAEWLNEQCERGGSYAKTELYRAYKWWCQKNGFGPLGRNRFSRQLREKGFPVASDNRTITGIRLTDAARKEPMPVFL